jgi:hypothetical protein
MDKLDDIVRGAARALEGTTPRGTFDELPSKIDARLEGISMQSQSEGASEQHGSREEHSGLHDIKELATTAKRRMSRRITTQNEAQDALFSTGSGLHAIALPDPAKMVSLPTVEEARALAASATGSHGVVAAAAEAPVDDLKVAREQRAAATETKKRAGWIYAVGAVAAAAAAVVAYVATRPGEPKDAAKSAAPALAQRDQEQPATAATGTAAGTSAAAPAPAARIESLQVDVAEPADVGLSGEAAADSAFVAPVVAADAEGEKVERKKDDAKKAPKEKANTGAEEPKGKGKGGDAVVDPAKTKAEPDPKVDPKATGGGGAKQPAGDDKPKDDLDKSIEDLLNSPVEKKKVDKPDKTELTSQELRAGLKAVEGDAKACYAKHQEAGTVKVKLTIDPSGKVSKAAATGSFAGTPSGDCVASALKGATFPAWDGAPMSTQYAVLLSD